MEKQIEKQEVNTFYRAIDVITDILLVPVVVLSIICSIVMFNSKGQNRVPSLFGYSAVQILSGSMTAGGFNIGDVVLIKRVPINTLKAGDIIGFYSKEDAQMSSHLSAVLNKYKAEHGASEEFDSIEQWYDAAGLKPQSMIDLNTVSTDNTGTDEQMVLLAANSKSAIYFHRIVEVYYYTANNTVTAYFVTRGDSNDANDVFLVHQGFVVGAYDKSLNWLGSVINFCGSINGIIFLVEVPCGILLCLLTVQLIQQIDELLVDKKGKIIRVKRATLKNLTRVLERRLVMHTNSTKKFKPWFDKYLYFVPVANVAEAEIRKVRVNRLIIRKSMKLNFTDDKSNTKSNAANKMQKNLQNDVQKKPIQNASMPPNNSNIGSTEANKPNNPVNNESNSNNVIKSTDTNGLQKPNNNNSKL